MPSEKYQNDTKNTSSRLTEEEVRHLARLARLALSESEVSLFQAQLSEVIDYNMSLLKELDVDDVSPTSQTTGLENVWREDETIPSLAQEIAIREAPKKQNGQFVVPQVLGES